MRKRKLGLGSVSHSQQEPSELLEAEKLTPEDIAAARKSLLFYALTVHKIRPEPFQEEWVRAIEKEKKVLITCPPGHGKTTWISVILPCWLLGRNPNLRIILVCAAEPPAVERSRAVINVLRSPLYKLIFPEIQLEEPPTSYLWKVKRSRIDDPFPTFLATGCGSHSIVGQRADLIVLDDPMNDESARSPTMRKALDEWIRRTLITRLTNFDYSRIVGIMTRWHQEDSAATLLSMGFHHIHHAATPEKPLWPSVYGKEFLKERKAELGEALFTCVYEGDPSQLEGLLIKREWLRIAETIPMITKSVIGVDLATSAKTTADFTVIVKLSFGDDGRYYVTGLQRFKAEWPEARKRIIKFVDSNPDAQVLAVESNAFQSAAVQDLRRELGNRVLVRGTKVNQDKITRCLAWLPYLEADNLRFLNLSKEVEDELAAFPRGKHDDVIDAISIAFETMRAKVVVEVF